MARCRRKLRDLEKLIHAFGEEFSFARQEVERIKKKLSGVVGAWRLREARHRSEHRKTRALLGTLFNGRIEKWIYASAPEDTKSFFKRVWRNETPEKPDERTLSDGPDLL